MGFGRGFSYTLLPLRRGRVQVGSRGVEAGFFSKTILFWAKQHFDFVVICFGILGKHTGLSPILILGEEQEAFK